MTKQSGETQGSTSEAVDDASGYRRCKECNGYVAGFIVEQSEKCTCVGRLFSEVKAERVTWLWEHRIPVGKVTLIDGDPGNGKSAMTTDFAARLTVGRPWPDGSPCKQGGVVICSAEDGEADTIRPRLDAAGGDPEKVLALATVQTGDDGDERLLSIPEDLQVLENGIERVKAKLVIVDPLMAFLSPGVNAHKDQDVRRALAPLARLAEETGAAVLVVRHLNKATGGNALYRGGGSIGIVGAARSALLVARHPEDGDRRVLAGLKSNLAPSIPSLAFALTEADNGAVKVEWKGQSHLSADTLLEAPMDQDERQEAAALRDAVKELLVDNVGEWEGTPKALYDLLADKDLSALPDRPDELSKRLIKLSRSQAGIKVSRTRKKDDAGKVVRMLKLKTGEHPFKPPNGVHGGNGGNGVHALPVHPDQLAFAEEF